MPLIRINEGEIFFLLNAVYHHGLAREAQYRKAHADAVKRKDKQAALEYAATVRVIREQQSSLTKRLNALTAS